jgi:alkyl sulfatase BDS1-like metallo-beta-lactamase superfamily hydrolase
LSPDSGAIQARVIIAGSGFSPVAANDSVFFNGIPASVVNADTNQLTVIVPKGATTGNVTVKVGGFVVAGPVFTVLPTILISSISPVHVGLAVRR